MIVKTIEKFNNSNSNSIIDFQVNKD